MWKEAFRLLGIDVESRVLLNGDTFFMVAMKSLDFHIAGRLLARGATCNHQNDLGETPLWNACQAGFVKAVESFVNYGVNITERDILVAKQFL
jgi:ankyrin repeat protein